ncbi:uncharacterized protein LOC110436643 [Sorghum bicolor]|uniref:uncharacterized protein LOC110436643 n=1 Tax=Sorghum bicolor TaxID=4558 RepID=UPI000B424452|nr:uncharacterized protein LOC110436643 [Sorghum bicolor]|eukprot:XP_021319743.1 uncharacterized protein LOC110436643 [Sorghum bicolor]
MYRDGVVLPIELHAVIFLASYRGLPPLLLLLCSMYPGCDESVMPLHIFSRRWNPGIICIVLRKYHAGAVLHGGHLNVPCRLPKPAALPWIVDCFAVHYWRLSPSRSCPATMNLDVSIMVLVPVDC